MSAKISFSDNLATVTVDGDLQAWGGWLGLVFLGLAIALCFNVGGFMKVLGWLCIAAVPFLVVALLFNGPNMSYRYVIDRAGQELGRINEGDGLVRRKTGKFMDVQVLSAYTVGRVSVRLNFVQLRCEQGVAWVASNLDHENAGDIAAQLARWLGVALMPSAEISHMETATIKLLIPNYSPWNPQGGVLVALRPRRKRPSQGRWD